MATGEIELDKPTVRFMMVAGGNRHDNQGRNEAVRSRRGGSM